jgi:hypothetical protein
LAFLVGILHGTAAHAQIGVSSTPLESPPEVVCTDLDLKKNVPCPDTALFFTMTKPALGNAYYTSDFKRLDALFDQWCTGKDRFPDGRWYLAFFGDGLFDLFSGWNTWPADLQKLKQWQKQRPQSQAAHYAEAVYWRAYAWKARGQGYGDTVSKEAGELFRERLGKARMALERIGDRNFKCAAPYPLLISVMIEQDAPTEQIEAVYQRGIRRFPEYHNIYFAMAKNYSPRWGGSEEKYERFASDVALRTRAFEGMGMYARIFWLEDDENGIPFRNVPGQPPYWSKLKAGYDDLERRYPSSMHNLGKYAGVACRTGDSALYRRLRTKIDGHEQTAEMLDSVDACDRRHGWRRAH